jgi:hypothetical protein
MALQERGEMRKKMYLVLVMNGLSLEGIQQKPQDIREELIERGGKCV